MIADMKNTSAARAGGSITAAQFLQRFVKEPAPWAHLDIAGNFFDQSTIADARTCWKKLKGTDGVEPRFWRQEGGRWMEGP
jgi:leucyl aminopeptidase